MNLMIVPGMFVCSSLLISVCMFIVSKALLISSATVSVRAGGAIWLNPFATVLFSVCRHCRVLRFVPVLHGCVWYVWCYVRKKALLQCLCKYWEEGYGPVWGALVCVFVGFWDWDYVSQLTCLRYYVFVKSSFKHTCEECEYKRAYVF